MAATQGYEALAVSGTAVGCTAATAANASSMHFRPEGGAVRYRSDGTAPTATVGTPLFDGESLEVRGKDFWQRIQFISKDGGAVTVHAHYFRD